MVQKDLTITFNEGTAVTKPADLGGYQQPGENFNLKQGLLPTGLLARPVGNSELVA